MSQYDPPSTCIVAWIEHSENPGERHKRGIAQSGSAPALGAGCRGFESLYPDQKFTLKSMK